MLPRSQCQPFGFLIRSDLAESRAEEGCDTLGIEEAHR